MTNMKLQRRYYYNNLISIILQSIVMKNMEQLFITMKNVVANYCNNLTQIIIVYYLRTIAILTQIVYCKNKYIITSKLSLKYLKFAKKKIVVQIYYLKFYCNTSHKLLQ